MSKGRHVWFLIALAGASMCLAVNGMHYWHEVRFAYAAQRFSLREIVEGEFNPHQFGGEIDQAASAGFYQAKFLHIATLKTLFSVIPPHRGGFGLAITLYLVLFGSAVMVARAVFREIFESSVLADLGVFGLVVSPIFPYMSGKLMSEVPALLCGALAVWTGQRALSAVGGARVRIWAWSSGLLTLLTLLSRFDLVTMVVGFWVAVVMTEAGPERRSIALRTLGMAGTIAIVGYAVILFAVGGAPYTLVRYFQDFSGAGARSPIMSVLGIVTFGGWTYLGMLLAFWSEKKDTRRFLLIWLVVSVGPIVVVTSQYMIEPRYLIHGLVPLAGLCALGLEAIRKRLSVGLPSAVVMAIIALATNWVAVRLMPYELNSSQLLAAVQVISREEPNAAILTPWSYTDFHFLQMMQPDRAIYNVNSDLPTTGPLAAAWSKRARSWYGDAFLNSPTRLEALVRQRPVYYLGWHRYPPLETASEWTRALGLVALSDRIASLPGRDHLTESWVWKSGEFKFDRKGRSGQYSWYQVTPR